MQPSKSDLSKSLGDVYGTTKQAAHTDEDKQKLAQAELFTGLLKQANIDPAHLTDAQISKLWKAAAGEMPPAAEEKKEEKKEEEKKKEESKKEAAAKEWASKRELQEKIAEADALGRVMAHAYAQELKKIAEFPPGFVPGGGAPAEGKSEGKSEEKKEEHESKETPAEEKKEEEKKKESQARAEALIAEFAKQASGSTTPNLDEQAAFQAISLLKAAGVDENLAFARINAVYTLGLDESAKIASAKTAAEAQTIRALEFCEAAKFSVDWSKV